MSTVDEPGPRPLADASRQARGRAALVAVAFLMATVVARVIVECGGGVAALAWLALSGVRLDDPEGLALSLETLPISLVAGLTIVQLALLGALAVGFAFLIPPMRSSLALRAGHPAVWGVALIGGLLVGTGPGWFAEILVEILPDWLQLGALDQIALWFEHGTVAGKLLLGLAVVVFAPICEELVFRGTLWSALRRFAPEWAVWLVTSALFAAYHLDPVHVITVFPIGLFIGWVRWRSGSLFPAILVHFLNNLLAAVTAIALPPDFSIPWWIALPAFAGTLLVAIPAAFVPAPAPEEV